MRHRGTIAVALLALVASACGTALSDEQAQEELGRDGAAAELAVGAGGGLDDGGGGGEGLAAGDVPGGVDGGTAGGTDTTVAAAGDGAAPAGGSQPAAGGGPGVAAANVSRGGATDVGVTPTDIKLGWVGTLTGPQPGLFRGALVGIQAFVNYQNSQGGLMGRRLSVVSADDALDSGKNRAAHLQLKDRVFAFVGSFSINDDGGASVINDCQCPDITGNLSRAMHDSPFHYGPQPAPPGWRSGPPRYYAKKYGKDVIEKMAFFYSQNGVAEAIARETRRVYEEAGFKVVYTRGVPPNDSNQTADVVQMQRAGVRAIAFQGDVTAIAKLATAMKQQNFKVDLLNLGNALYDANAFKLTTPDALQNLQIDQVYSLFLGEDAGRIPEIRLFNEWMKKTDPRQPVDLFAMYGWLSGRLFADAMTKMAQAGKNPVRKDLVETLKGIGQWDGNGMVAPVQIGTKRASDCFFVFTATPDGKFARTYPEGGSNYACDQGPFSPAR